MILAKLSSDLDVLRKANNDLLRTTHILDDENRDKLFEDDVGMVDAGYEDEV
eukprot:CAMPEP_0114596016 /NCGR_PEP_ID=MMETSP0125-20121206/17959_1 /TAXON_ID=485358 ORGANISM="Aristerostoma sp., Strain ATCC 50986" /NCGR_SAMPLE_ID=MMETSP0125 /ASSEMBLY_ACC=CAM_ASM_000245 /LENGTH=51 /DNA_ID=CAMNT_0001798471 /DNA_START=2398 /DNA_END=2553 /DNA_ORIENTATION=+